MDLFKTIKEFKHQKGDIIKDNTIRSYCIIIKKLHNDTEDYENLNFLDETKLIMKKINNISKLTTRKNYLTAVIVSLPCVGKDNSFYVKEKLKVNEEYNNQLSKNEKTETQEKNWFTKRELIAITAGLEELAKPLMKKELLNKKERFILQDYVIALLYTCLNDFVVRLDYAPMLVRNEKDIVDCDHNYLAIVSKDVKYFILNKYKNAEYIKGGIKRGMGKVTIPIPERVNTAINALLKHNKTDIFLTTINGKVMTENALGRAIKRIFTIGDKSATINIIRHVCESENINIDRRKKEKELAFKLLHSDNQQLQYAKY